MKGSCRYSLVVHCLPDIEALNLVEESKRKNKRERKGRKRGRKEAWYVMRNILPGDPVWSTGGSDIYSEAGSWFGRVEAGDNKRAW